MDRCKTITVPWDHRHHHLDVPLVQIGEHFFGVAFEHAGIEFERGLLLVLSIRGEPSAQIADAIERDLFLSEGIDDFQHLRFAPQITVRLLIAHHPLRRQHRLAGEGRNVLHEGRGILCVKDEDIVGARDKVLAGFLCVR
jgi:hypothetical protein